MKVELILLLHTGMSPLKIHEKTGESKQLIYYYRKQYEIGKKKFDKVIAQ